MSQNIAKSMAYNIDKSGDDFQQDGCVYKPTIASGFQWIPEPREYLTGLRNKPQHKQTCQLVIS